MNIEQLMAKRNDVIEALLQINVSEYEFNMNLKKLASRKEVLIGDLLTLTSQVNLLLEEAQKNENKEEA